MNADGLISRVLEHLLDDDPDYPSERWTRSQVLFHISHGLQLLALADPASFTCTKRTLLVEGNFQPLADDCSTFVTAEAVWDKAEGGKRLYSVRNTKFTHRTAPFECTPEKFKLGSVSFDAMRNRVMIVDPPVPAGFTGWLEYHCACVPAPSDAVNLDVPIKHEIALFEFALYRLYDSELESQYAQGKATAHLNMFLRLAKMSTQSLKQLESATTSPRSA